ncbi:MAG: hypothetical protein COW30_02470 [Rhodospirillales bacterium CG15_BIG_FIL_POST_REV_8_21_14_020_66_15]|nr:MAG: hypothetical protein COW30_02470 [Rhodospirillales bacterium CG15_BIG_FIL_POST_REV_8_21_14_020_66_15]
MSSMSARTFTLWRCNCGLHAFNRAAEQGIPISYQEIERLNAWIERARPAFEIDGRTRFRVNVHRGNGQRIRVIYDTALATVVTVMAKTSYSPERENAHG